MEKVLGFLRGTFYFWPEILDHADPTLTEAPKILGVGDIHIENFGTWRDAEGRLIWGVNDFDDAARVPFACDVVRLAASAIIGVPETSGLRQRPEEVIVEAYAERLGEPPNPFVLEDRFPALRNLATADGAAATQYWKEFRADRVADREHINPRAFELLLRALPSGAHAIELFAPLSGTGSLGRPRYAVLAEFRGGLIAREIKAAAPSALHLGVTDIMDPTADYRLLEATAIRVRDPFLTIDTRWVSRRLSPESRKIEHDDLKNAEDWRALLRAMGAELANIHIGSAATTAPLLEWIGDGGHVRIVRASTEAAKIVRDLHKELKPSH